MLFEKESRLNIWGILIASVIIVGLAIAGSLGPMMFIHFRKKAREEAERREREEREAQEAEQRETEREA